MKKRRAETGNEFLSAEQFNKGFKALNIKPYNGKAKKVERYFQAFSIERR